MSIIAIDPGGVTGIAVYSGGPVRLYEWEGGFEGMCNWLQCTSMWDVSAIVIESFTINAGTHKKDPVAIYDTLYIIGAVHFVARAKNIPVVMQSPQKAKSFGTDDKLRRLGWYNPSKGGHQNDAVRHLVTYLASIRDPKILAALVEEG